MAAVFDILREERDRLIGLKARYSEQLAEFPTGSISHKLRGHRMYCYLARREGKRVRFVYIGPADSQRVRDLTAQLERRDEIRRKLKQVQVNLRAVERGLHGQ